MNNRYRPLGGARSCALAIAASLALAAAGCESDNQQIIKDASNEEKAILAVKSIIQGHLDNLYEAAKALEAAAPEADADGWSATADAAAVNAMKEQWKKARLAYESVEGAIAVVFPDLDVSTDARYDHFIEVAPDDNLFDDTGVTGVHGIERILWSDSIPAPVVSFESGLANYKAAAFPANEQEAKDFKTKLCARFTADAKAMAEGFKPKALDATAAYRGVIGSLEEQIEKVNKAATGEEESRYAQFTLGDMKQNVAAGRATYGAFQAWVLDKGGAEIDAGIVAGFQRLDDAYAALQGDALPPVPDGWSSENPTKDHLATPFGQLFAKIKAEADAAAAGSLVSEMLESADLLGIDPLP